MPGGSKPTVVQGVIAFVDNQVDRTTGTIGVKVLAENADEALWPGQSVEVALTVEVKPQHAVGAGGGRAAGAAGHDHLGGRTRTTR